MRECNVGTDGRASLRSGNVKFDPDRHHRRSLRLQGYDYSQAGAYFVTICTQDRECLFGKVVTGQVDLSKIGRLVTDCWHAIPQHFDHVVSDEFVVMPNHIHGIIVIAEDARVGVQYIEPLQIEPLQIEPLHGKPGHHAYQHVIPQSVGSIVRSYKAAVTRFANENERESIIWQRSYYEHVIRHERALNAIREYIRNNPLNWAQDIDHPSNAARPMPDSVEAYLREAGV